MLRRIPTLMGLNLRQSEINRPPEFAQDCRNVEKNSKGEVVLRWGYEKVLDELGIIDLFEYVGAQSDPNRGALLALKENGLSRLEGSSLVPVPRSHNDTYVWSQQTKAVEYNKVLYWNDPSFSVDLWKYDGYTQYRAGVPRVNIVGTNASGTGFFYRVLVKFYDLQGNVTWSDYQQNTIQSASGSIEVTVKPSNDITWAGFYQKYCKFQQGGSFNNQLINAFNPTAIGIVEHNYVENDYVRLELQGGRFVTPVRIASVTANTITFDSSFLGTGPGKEFTVNDPVFQVLERRWDIEIYRSVNQFTNYERMSKVTANTALNTETSNFTILTSGLFVDSVTQSTQSLGEVYDDSLVRVLPPKGKYITLYNEFMVIGNLGKEQEDFGYAQLNGNDTRLEDAIVWSDIATLSNGSSIETFLVNNIRSVGASEDGALVALHGNDDNLVVHKEKQSYYLNGDLITNNLRVRKAMTESIGTASHRSIRNVEGGHLYTTPRGVYLSVGGSKPVELSEIIEPLFTDNALELDTLLLDQAKSVTDFLREKIYIYIPQQTDGGIVLVYDYYHKDWWLHDNIPADKGFQDVGISSTEIYFADSTGLYRRDLTSQKDLTKKINAYYWTGWFDLEAPTIVKKFINFIMLSIAKKDFTATIKGYCNWQTGTEEASNTIDFSDKVSSEDSQVLQVQANSVSYRISNEKCGGNLHITSYEVEYEPTQTKPKGTA